MNYSSIVKYPCNTSRNPLTDEDGLYKSELLNVVVHCSTNFTIDLLLLVREIFILLQTLLNQMYCRATDCHESNENDIISNAG